MTAQIIDLAARRSVKREVANTEYLDTLAAHLEDLAELMGIEIADDATLGGLIVAAVTALASECERLA